MASPYPAAKWLIDEMAGFVAGDCVQDVQYARGVNDGEVHWIRWGGVTFCAKDEEPARPHFWAVLHTQIGTFTTVSSRPQYNTRTTVKDHAAAHAMQLVHRLLACVVSAQHSDSGEQTARALANLGIVGHWPGLESVLHNAPVFDAGLPDAGHRTVILGGVDG